METQMTLSELRNRGNAKPAIDAAVGFESISGFDALQRMAGLFAESPITPDTFRAPYTVKNYRGEAEQKGCDTAKAAIGACAIALDMALRMHANPLMVMQNLYVVHGRPAWSAKFLIATLNKSGRFSALRYAFQGKEGTDEWGCRAVAKELATGEVLSGPLITIALAKAEGWYGKKGSKWPSMPAMMLQYRAASWFVSTYAPDICMGLPEADELREPIDITPQEPEEPQENTVTVADIEKKVRRGRKPKVEPSPALEHEQPLTQAQEHEVEPSPMPEPEEIQEAPESLPEPRVTPMGSYEPPVMEPPAEEAGAMARDLYDAAEDAFYAQDSTN